MGKAGGIVLEVVDMWMTQNSIPLDMIGNIQRHIDDPNWSEGHLNDSVILAD